MTFENTISIINISEIEKKKIYVTISWLKTCLIVIIL